MRCLNLPILNKHQQNNIFSKQKIRDSFLTNPGFFHFFLTELLYLLLFNYIKIIILNGEKWFLLLYEVNHSGRLLLYQWI